MNHDLLKLAQDGLAIVDVYSRDFHAFLHEDFDPKSHDAPTLSFQHKFHLKNFEGLEATSDDVKFDVVRFHIMTGLRLLPSDINIETLKTDEAEKHVMAEITATFVSEYRLMNPDLSKEAMEEFGKHNTMLHIWPYWREFIQSACSRMHLDPVVLPMYRVPRKQKEASPEKDASPEKEK